MSARYRTIVGDAVASAHLAHQNDPHGTSFAIQKNLTIVGRDGATADIVVDDLQASRRHAQIRWNGAAFVIEDLQSLNGTLLNGTPLAEAHLLRQGDQIGIGRQTLIFSLTQVATGPGMAQSAPSNAATTGVASRRAVTDALQINQRVGNENLGFLSEEHGFLPSEPPRLQLPPAFAAWDEIAARLPDLWRSITVREELTALPVLDASADSLPDEDLLRASVIMSMLAHSYHRISDTAPQHPMPPGVQEPWEQISRRLGRLAPHLSYVDLILYNWKLIDPTIEDPFQLSNLDLLVSTVDNQEEKVFYLVQVEAHHRMAAMVGSMIRAQEAALAHDAPALKRELIAVMDDLQTVATSTFMGVNPNRYSQSFVDPVVWAKTVAPFAVPIADGTVGPSGSGAPAFHLLDTFFERVDYDSRLGHEMLELRSWYPAHWRTFFDAIGEVSVRSFVDQSGDRALQGIYKEAALCYAGDDGFLRQHMIKAYGYLELAFKVGRSVTIGGFSGSFSDRVWDLVVDEMVNSQVERANTLPRPGHTASVRSVQVVSQQTDSSSPENGGQGTWVKKVVFDVAGAGMRYRPGDRCAVLPESSDTLVNKTLGALRATGDEEITLTSDWRQAIDLRPGYEGATSLPLRTLLKFGRIRPVDRTVAKALYGASDNGLLRRIIESRGEDQWELWDLLTVLAEAGMDPKRLWKANPGQREHICRIVPMDSFRMYSISSTMDPAALDGADEITLTVGRLAYATADTELSQRDDRQGSASHFLGNFSAAESGQVSLRIVRPTRFALPTDPTTPIVMFAGGTGLAPFRSFLGDRIGNVDGGENWLFLGCRTRSDVHYESELASMVAARRLHVRAAFSRDAVRLSPDVPPGAGEFADEPGESRYINDEILAADNAETLLHLLRRKEDGGAGAYFYVCGHTGFATSVMDALQSLVERSLADTGHAGTAGGGGDAEAAASETLYRLVGEGRYMQDIFTTYTGSHLAGSTTFDASEIVQHNNPDDGYWMVVDGRVYDMDKFVHLHPGGAKIIQASAGMDATAAYRKVLHHLNPEVDSMLGMYEIGAVRRLQFGREWATVIAPDGLRSLLLSDAYRAWVRMLYNVTEMENAFLQDCAVKDQRLIGNDDPASFPPIKLQYLLEAHDRFAASYLVGTTGEGIEDLWALTSGFCSPDSDVRWMRDQIANVLHRDEAETLRRISGDIQRRIDHIVANGVNETDPAVEVIKNYCSVLHAEDLRYLAEIKQAIRTGVMAFEQHESETIRRGGDQLMAAIQSIPHIVASYQSRVLSGVLRLWL